MTTRTLPQLIVPQYNVGWMGYLMNLATAGITAGLIGKWRGPAAGRSWLLGGFAFSLSRIIDEFAGLKILQFAQFAPGSGFQLAGDATYGMRGVYAGLSFPLPSNSLAMLPAAVAAPVASANGETANAGMGWDRSFN